MGPPLSPIENLVYDRVINLRVQKVIAREHFRAFGLRRFEIPNAEARGSSSRNRSSTRSHAPHAKRERLAKL